MIWTFFIQFLSYYSYYRPGHLPWMSRCQNMALVLFSRAEEACRKIQVGLRQVGDTYYDLVIIFEKKVVAQIF